ncbi:hypothetical protein J2W27_006493 [Variovorax boronicumulans]|uniref:hypothetical protein n=1 Tax=Variovorax boronicumulans TaxID=436515 RepID=UPI0027816B82|nr:hypothetical protein [Variovorax boronicumulans]MDP9914353.1 hypothetical protein [Variovorax boronicumulans]
MKMKILDYTLLTLLSGATPFATGQVVDVPVRAPGTVQPASSEPECTENACRSDGSLLFQLQTRGLREPVTRGTTEKSGDKALEPDRRVTLELPADRPPGKAIATGKFSVQLPGGGVVWATEDPTLGLPELSVSAPAMVPFENGQIKGKVQFFVRSNYPGFIKSYELKVYRASDAALTEPLATVPISVSAVSQASWDGQMVSRYPLRAGDELMYVLRAYGADGAADETQPRLMQLVRPEDAERGATLLRDSAEKSRGSAMTVQQAQTQRLIDNVFTANDLRQQNISIYGSRIRIQGRNLPPESNLEINGNSYPSDLERKFVAEFLSPIGQHSFEIVLKNADKTQFKHTLNVDVTGHYFFGVAMADLTVFQNSASGAGRELALNGREEDVLANGRLGFYGKAKVNGKYLITAQADTQERDVRDLFTGFTRADPKDVFRRLDPNQYYPVYGDDSTTYRDVDTQGRFYLRADWDKNQALWGNFYTGITGTEYAQYVRSLYGAAIKWRSKETNPWGDAKTQARAFASQAQTAPGHSEFLGTGGSLYYLRHTDLMPGSDIVTVEVRNPATGRVENRRTLQRGVDYEINEMQGRIMLTRPLAQVASDNLPSITRDTPLAGNQQHLLVDYEWIPTDFNAGNVTAGARAQHWVTDNVAVGGTYVEERRSGDNYRLMGADVTLQAGRGTYVKLEHSKTKATSAPAFFSNNGGFTFTQTNPFIGPREGAATAIDAQANLKELGWTDREWTLGAWWRKVDAGYSIARSDNGMDISEYGAQVRGKINDELSLYALQSRTERGAERLDQTQVTAEWRPTENDTVSAELRRITQHRLEGDANGTLGALRYARRVTPNLDVYGVAQFTLDDDGGKYAKNDAYTLGAKYRFGNLSSVGAEVTRGDRGNAAQVTGEYRLTPEHSVYGTFTHSTDTTQYDSVFNSRLQSGWTVGQRWRLGEKTNLFNESQFLKEPNGTGLAHTFGMDFYPSVGWNAGFTLQKGELSSITGDVHRRAISISAGRTSPQTDWRSKLEWREDSGAEQRTQWVSTNSVNHKINEDWRVSAKFNYSDTRDKRNALAGAKFVEGGAGFAWRPHDNTRWAVLGRYTYLYDLATLGQMGGAQYDQKSHIFSVEGIYHYDHQWEFAAKLARREGHARFGRGTGQWFDSATTFAAAQARYELPQQWHALAEYRALLVKDGGTRKGWLVGVDRDITKNLRIGVGYNFTNFSDDLTKFDYKYKGWFINLVGTY